MTQIGTGDYETVTIAKNSLAVKAAGSGEENFSAGYGAGPTKEDVEAHGQPRWYAAYTTANHEKRVAEQFGVRDVEHFLPTYFSVRRWKDRRVTLALPLFPGYVFVHMPLRDRLRVLQVPGVSRLVGFNGTPCALPEEEMAALRSGLTKGVCPEPHPFLTVGRRVRVKSGPLAGMQGILLRRRGKFRIVISIELIQRSVSVDADVADVEALR